MTVDPERVAEAVWSATRPKVLARSTEADVMPPWDQLPDDQINSIINSTTETIAALRDNGYDIIKTDQ